MRIGLLRCRRDNKVQTYLECKLSQGDEATCFASLDFGKLCSNLLPIILLLEMHKVSPDFPQISWKILGPYNPSGSA